MPETEGYQLCIDSIIWWGVIREMKLGNHRWEKNVIQYNLRQYITGQCREECRETEIYDASEILLYSVFIIKIVILVDYDS